MNLLLDTCTFLWLAAEPEKLSQPAKDAFDDDANAFYLSDASCWEIVLKYSAGKLPLPAAPRIWIPRQVSFFQLLTLPIEREAIFTTGDSPKSIRIPSIEFSPRNPSRIHSQ